MMNIDWIDYPMPTNQQRMDYLDKPELSFVSYNCARLLHYNEKGNCNEKESRLLPYSGKTHEVHE